MKIKGLRWWVVTLVALATVINYIDRQTLNVLWPAQIAPDLFPEMSADGHKHILGIVSVVFIFSYALGQAIFGKIFDWVGTRLGFVLSIGVWSLATAAHAFAQGVLSFSVFRSILGMAEAGNWPGAAKANAEWFPVDERALAQGIFNSGAAIGGIISIPLIAYLAIFLDWKLIFILVGAVGLLWLVPWLVIVKAPPKYHAWLSDGEREYILRGQINEDLNDDGNLDGGYNPSTPELLSRKQSWGVIIASAAIDPIWWLFIIWIPTYLFEVHDFNIKELAASGWLPYVGAMIGAWFGGLLAQSRLKAGWSVNKTRKFTITLGCLIMLPALLAMAVAVTPALALGLMFVILFGFQTAIGNVQTLPSDFYGGKTVGTLSGFAGMAAKLAAAGLTYLVPWLTMGANYAPVFVLGAALAITAIASVWILCGEIRPLKPRTIAA
ncbi:MFS transporter [Hyphomonas johnsonii]|uniref:Major facilitator transporter n=1 Tax=Hyphomonas johnsonii MHS-2 TaxID=1280950 RepID=A0A059FSK7_9PROT|nr:MFS transporter [Hyphomonas johnsonii]KCZ93448.1 major facilitator transporter [Hyphomonas johnsonii MHS-2]